MEPSFINTQRQLADHLRDPQANAAPAGLEDRRLKIYRDLIYNNVEGFIRGGFPILHKIIPQSQWHDLVRDFIVKHESHSPYFLDIGQEFLQYLQTEREAAEIDPPFMLELAHYEWVELALDVADQQWPSGVNASGDLLAARPVVSPLVWCLSYEYPVHRLGPSYTPTEPPEQPTFLLVYRTRTDQVAFMESSAVTHRLIQLLQGEDELTGREALMQIARELQAPDTQAIVTMGASLLEQLRDKDIICGTKS